ncbi:MAG TPA: hypothetical protein VEC56_07670 [Candidatus Krumholzibacteria bacterium]|nr:hypothetical protein [Candidatus Krumholzibacteria bacterium]
MNCNWAVTLVVGLSVVVAASRAACAERALAEWMYSASVYGYFVPDDRDYVQPTISADRGVWHAELRYNYEDLETGSAWAGYTFAAGTELEFAITPMLGGVFGRTVGVAPGFRCSIDYRALAFYSEGEHFLDAESDFDSFFYSWSELSVSPGGVIEVGAAAQKTQAYESARDIHRGFLLGTSFESWGATVYVFNPDLPDPTYVLAAHADF